MFDISEPSYQEMKVIRKRAAMRKLKGKIESLKMLIDNNPDLKNEMKQQLLAEFKI